MHVILLRHYSLSRLTLTCPSRSNALTISGQIKEEKQNDDNNFKVGRTFLIPSLSSLS